ncbi:uncharacterized protein LOC124649736 [Lolium rigidum]|uniref:uncharacterized protein LOC124649736 n=1 Tax=Lolium rigidum TaxID=89674 RepID=UPI001F5D20BC|nr:uncharacterized protein LOC124649736 [Lolium rigidum]
MAALLRQGARRIGGSVLQRTQAAVTSPAVAEERRLLVPRRMLSSHPEEDEFKDLKPIHQVLWELIVNFPARKIITLMAGTSLVVMIATDGSEVKVAEKKQERVKG